LGGRRDASVIMAATDQHFVGRVENAAGKGNAALQRCPPDANSRNPHTLRVAQRFWLTLVTRPNDTHDSIDGKERTRSICAAVF
jgi:hypothetical protein